jgi:hypothetical protein
VPYLEKGNGRAGDIVSFEKPAEGRQLTSVRVAAAGMTILVLATKEEDIANYHYTFYNALAALIADTWQFGPRESFYQQLREELSAEVHGEVDERSWHLKQALVRRQTNARKETKLFRDYARQAFEDTLTLYLHGTCTSPMAPRSAQIRGERAAMGSCKYCRRSSSAMEGVQK